MDSRASNMTQPWTRDELTAEVARLGPWFHAIDLGHGVRTKHDSQFGEPVDHPMNAWQGIRRCMPDDLSGMSVLDVGCNGGFYAVEAKRRNAARVLGVDAARHHVQQAQFVRSALGLDIEFRRRSVYGLDPNDIGRFDIVLALGLIYHCKHPMLALERLFDVTKTTLILESAILPESASAAPLALPLGAAQATMYPIAFVDNPPGVSEAAENWFLPTPACLEAMLRAVGFTDVTRASVADGRVVLVATKPSHQAARFAARLTLIDAPASVALEAECTMHITAENIGAVVWPAAGEFAPGQGPVHLGAHLYATDLEETVLNWDWGRGAMSSDLGPGNAATIEIRLRAPAMPGRYLIEFDMVAEHFAWFDDLGSRPIRVEFTVTRDAPRG